MLDSFVWQRGEGGICVGLGYPSQSFIGKTITDNINFMPQLAERNTRYIYDKLAGVRMQQKLGHVKLSSILPSPWSTVRLVSANGSTVSFNGHSDHLEYHTFYSLSIRIEKKWASWSRLGEDTKKEKKELYVPLGSCSTITARAFRLRWLRFGGGGLLA